MTKTTRELVFEAATKLFLQGQKPSVATVRALIGQGSNTTIQEALNDWWQELSNKFGRLQSHPDVPEELGPLLSQLWLEAVKKADANLSTDREKMAEQLREEQGRLAALSGEADLLRQANADMKTQVSDLSNRLETATSLQLAAHSQSEQLRAECQSLKETLQGERRLSEDARAAHQVAIDKMVHNLEEAQRKMLLEVDAARQESAKARNEAKADREALQAKLDKAVQEVQSLEELRRENGRLSASLNQANQEKAHLIDQIALLGNRQGRKPIARRGGKVLRSSSRG